MEEKSTLGCIFDDLVNALSGVIDRNRIFMNDRPCLTDSSKPMDKFIVVDLPSEIDDNVIGDKDTMLNTYGVFHLFTRAKKNNSLNVNATGVLVDGVKRLFPIKGEYVVCSSPVVRLKGADGNSYQVVIISFKLRSRWNAFAPQENVSGQ